MTNIGIRVQQHFDENLHEYTDKHAEPHARICEERIATLATFFNPSQPINVLDIGCGGGRFSDLLLTRFPNATVYALDLSLSMLRKNSQSARKHRVQADCTGLPFASKAFDIINIDTVMHHLVSGAGYAHTLHRIEEFLRSLRQILRPEGVLAVREIYHESIFLDEFHTRVIYEMTIRRLPAALASLARIAGVKTANVGVCFLSRRQWKRLFAGLLPTSALLQERPWSGRLWPYRVVGLRADGDYYCFLQFSRGREGG